MQIPYNKRQQRNELIIGILITFWGLVMIWTNPGDLFRYYLLFLGILLVAAYLFKQKYPYIKLENGVLTVYRIRTKSLKLSEVVRINRFAGNLTLFTAEGRLTINRRLIDGDSRILLDRQLASLDPEAAENTSEKIAF